MHLKSSCVYLSVLLFPASAGWLEDVISPEGYRLGNGITLHLTNSKHLSNDSFFDNHMLKMNYLDYGLSLGRIANKSALEMSLYKNTKEEGRGKKEGDDEAMSFVIGYKMATMMTLIFVGLAGLVFKAIVFSKIAIVASLIMLLCKLFGVKNENESYHHSIPAYVEYENAPELDYHPDMAELHTSASGNYLAYANYIPTSEYSTVEGAIGNSTNSTYQQVAGAKRRNFSKRRRNHPLITIREYSVD